jgi:hypothetical protein
MAASKVQDFLSSYLEEYVSSASESSDAIKTPIMSPVQTEKMFRSLSKFEPSKGPNLYEEFLVLQKNPQALGQLQIAQNSPGFVNAMSMFGG